jgi:hypothetical protein
VGGGEVTSQRFVRAMTTAMKRFEATTARIVTVHPSTHRRQRYLPSLTSRKADSTIPHYIRRSQSAVMSPFWRTDSHTSPYPLQCLLTTTKLNGLRHQSEAPVGPVPPTRIKLRLQRQTETHAKVQLAATSPPQSLASQYIMPGHSSTCPHVLGNIQTLHVTICRVPANVTICILPCSQPLSSLCLGCRSPNID